MLFTQALGPALCRLCFTESAQGPLQQPKSQRGSVPCLRPHSLELADWGSHCSGDEHTFVHHAEGTSADTPSLGTKYPPLGNAARTRKLPYLPFLNF